MKSIRYRDRGWTMKELSEEFDIKYSTLKDRLRRGLSIEEALKPVTRKIPEDEFRKAIAKKDIELMESYKGSEKKHKFRCKKCGYTWKTQASHVKTRGTCRECFYARRRKTTESFQEEIRYRGLIVLGEYVDNKTKIKLQCTLCDNVWDARPSQISQRSGCPKCGQGIKSWSPEIGNYK